MLSFRPATPADVPTIRALADRIWRACYRDILTPGQLDYMLGRMFSEEVLLQQISAGVEWELAALDGTDVAFLSMTREPGGGRVELNKLYLVPELHGRGFGQAMLVRVLANAAARGAREVHLRVNKANRRAIAAYERAGFRLDRPDVRDIGGGFVMDDFIYVRGLPG